LFDVIGLPAGPGGNKKAARFAGGFFEGILLGSG
jgi:hypothetical protein